MNFTFFFFFLFYIIKIEIFAVWIREFNANLIIEIAVGVEKKKRTPTYYF